MRCGEPVQVSTEHDQREGKDVGILLINSVLLCPDRTEALAESVDLLRLGKNGGGDK